MHVEIHSPPRLRKLIRANRGHPRISVLGAGNIGTALAWALARKGYPVRIWDHFPEVVDDIRTLGENRRYLPGIPLPATMEAADTPGACVEGARLVVLGMPSLFVGAVLPRVQAHLGKGALLLNAAKGFAPETRELIPVHVGRLLPDHPCVHLAGPALANEIVRGQRASVVLAAAHAPAAARVARLLAGDHFLPTATGDLQGAALGGILKNVYAILLGCMEALTGKSRNLEASVITASLREMVAIAVPHGGEASTLHGLAGLGDLVATGLSQDSHNRRFGQWLARSGGAAGTKPAPPRDGWPEGARAAGPVCALAAEAGVPAPLAGWVRRVLAGAPPSREGLMRAWQTSMRSKAG